LYPIDTPATLIVDKQTGKFSCWHQMMSFSYFSEEGTDTNEGSNDQKMCPDVHVVSVSVPSASLIDVDKVNVLQL